MTILQFVAPPLPHYVVCGEDTYQKGRLHPNRNKIGVFDLLVVTKGHLFIGEEAVKWEVGAAQALIIRPDNHHYTTQMCQEETHFYWLHFQTLGEWAEVSDYKSSLLPQRKNVYKPIEHFKILLPRYTTLTNPEATYRKFKELLLLLQESVDSTRWKEQILFQSILDDLELTTNLSEEKNSYIDSSVREIAEKTASYLRKNYRQQITYQHINEYLNFHPTYISRCMKQVFGCTPLEYLTSFRLEKSKILLINSDMTISDIADEVGFYNPSYFTRCFSNNLNVTPRKFRKGYRA
jgi:AraC-like DNA-binding protein